MSTTPEDVRRLAAGLADARDDSVPPRLAFSVLGRAFAWSWLERVHPRKPRVLRPDVLAVSCALDAKAELLAAQPQRYFEDAHHHGYPAVLVRLDEIDEEALADLLEQAWRRARRGKRPG